MFKNNQTKPMFTLNLTNSRYDINTRYGEKFVVTKCNTKRLQNSAIPHMKHVKSEICFVYKPPFLSLSLSHIQENPLLEVQG